jgi:hypothetical protein
VFGAEPPVEVPVPSRVVIDAPGLTVLEVEIRDPGERTLTWGPCGLRLRVEAPDGGEADGVAFVDGHLYRTQGGHLVLDGLAAGAHRILVSPVTRNHVGVEWRVVLADGEVREKTVRFTLR